MKLAQIANDPNLSIGMIKQTDEFKELSQRAEADRAVHACRLIARNSVGNTTDALEQALRQAQVLHTAQRNLVGKWMRWTPSGPIKNARQQQPTTDFVKLLLGEGDVDFKPEMMINCWEVVLSAAMLDGQVVNLAKLRDFYLGRHTFFEGDLVAALTSMAPISYEPQRLLGQPLPGDVVLFSGIDHVALATGTSVSGPWTGVPTTMSGTRVVSFWPAPRATNFGPGATATVEVTTIEGIELWWQINKPDEPPMTVTFGSPNWKELDRIYG